MYEIGFNFLGLCLLIVSFGATAWFAAGITANISAMIATSFFLSARSLWSKIKGSRLNSETLWKFRMWLARKIIGTETQFLCNANLLDIGGIHSTEGLVFMYNTVIGSLEYIEKHRAELNSPQH